MPLGRAVSRQPAGVSKQLGNCICFLGLRERGTKLFGARANTWRVHFTSYRVSLKPIGALPWDLLCHFTREQDVSTALWCKGAQHQKRHLCRTGALSWGHLVLGTRGVEEESPKVCSLPWYSLRWRVGPTLQIQAVPKCSPDIPAP